jgi:predicted anti-sigma-YlaC factor YlaD
VGIHLRECGECRELAAELERLSRLLASAPMAPMPPSLMERLERSLWAARERSVLRLAEWLTATAAAVLIGALLVWPGARQDEGLRASASGGGSWPAAIMPPAEAHDGDVASAELVGVAQWMANDLSNEPTR